MRLINFLICLGLSILLLTPSLILRNLSLAIEYIVTVTGLDEKALTYVALYLDPLVVMLVNNLLIPCLIDAFTYYESYRRKSSRQNNVMHRNFFFMFINIFILPVMQE